MFMNHECVKIESLVDSRFVESFDLIHSVFYFVEQYKCEGFEKTRTNNAH